MEMVAHARLPRSKQPPSAWPRLAPGLVAAGGWLMLLGLMPTQARASSPAAWRAYDVEVRQACLKATTLKQPKVLGQRIDVPQLSMSVLLLSGRDPHGSAGSQPSRELCLFTQEGRRAVVAGAEPLDRPRWPYPAPGAMDSQGGNGAGLR